MKHILLQGPWLALILLAGMLLPACSDGPAAPGDPGPEIETTEGYPVVPRPSGPDDFDGPDESERFELIVPIAGKDVDFAPTWTTGTFTWNIDIQTQYETLTVWGWEPDADPASGYYAGTTPSTALLFEGGAVDLRNPYPKNCYLLHEPGPRVPRPIPRRLMLVEGGETLAAPYNPQVNASDCFFDFGPDYGSPDVRFDPGLMVAYWDIDVEPGFNQRHKKRLYYVGITSAPSLTNPVHIKRERYWERVLVDGTRSVRADEGFSKSVSYTVTHGASMSASETFAETTEVGASLSPFDVGLSVKDTTERTHGRTSEITEETAVTVTHELSGIQGKTVIFSVWQSVEAYSFVDENGDPYTDPSYTFADLGNLEVRGDHEVLQSAIFDAE